jgi:hypothetical protein
MNLFHNYTNHLINNLSTNLENNFMELKYAELVNIKFTLVKFKTVYAMVIA